MPQSDKVRGSSVFRPSSSHSQAFHRSPSVSRLCTDAMLLCIALILSWLDTLIPFPFGMKAGLANCVVMTASRQLSPKDAAVISLLRIGIMSVLFGSVTSLAFSLGGGILSYAVLLLTLPLSRSRKITLVGISVLSSGGHIIGQMIAACLLFGSLSPLGMLWWLLLCSIPTGIFTGIASELILRRIGKKGYC